MERMLRIGGHGGVGKGERNRKRTGLRNDSRLKGKAKDEMGRKASRIASLKIGR